MLGTLLRSGALISVLTQVTGAPSIDFSRVQSPAPYAPQPTSDGAIASAIAEWRAIGQTDALPFDSYARFLLAHPGWPNETANRRAAERQAGVASPISAITFFRRFPPQSTNGMVAHARALAATGDQARAREEARRAWRVGGMSAADENTLLSTFGFALTPADHDAHVDALLWAGGTSAAARAMPLTSPAMRPVLEARLALRSSAVTAGTIDAERFRSDAGFIADRATWLRNNGAGPSARSWLARPRQIVQRPGNVERWYEMLLTSARAASADGQHQLAYDIARQVDDAYPPGTDVSAKPYGERDDYTSLAWLAGQSAMKIGRPADASVMFDRYGLGVKSPQTRAKGFYWAARAAAQGGRTAEATALFERTAAFRDQYHGQLATERLGRALLPPAAPLATAVAPTARAAWDARDLVRAVRFLGQIGARQDQTAFVRRIAEGVETESDQLLAVELSRALSRPDLAVMASRTAAQNGLTAHSAAGFPTVPVPGGYERNWVIIHAITRQESQFDRTAMSSAGARGLMQLMPGTAREQAGKIGVTFAGLDSLTADPNLSIMLGSSYFDRMYANYGSYPLAIAAYNAGPGNVNKWLRLNGDPRAGAVDAVDWVEAIPFTETRGYVQRVLENAVAYDLLNPARARSRGNTRLSWYLGRGSRTG
ncbi:lytic transglycosylase domain-containing protein [uncultured Sphingomonas sp.]|uniref:lytic transglycosylase domain-containing protein n=1 Tax=uncultured Sphingomonas sp. TaxID=158754 RepID=UPI0035CBCCA3